MDAAEDGAELKLCADTFDAVELVGRELTLTGVGGGNALVRGAGGGRVLSLPPSMGGRRVVARGGAFSV